MKKSFLFFIQWARASKVLPKREKTFLDWIPVILKSSLHYMSKAKICGVQENTSSTVMRVELQGKSLTNITTFAMIASIT